MFDFAPDPDATKAKLYDELEQSAAALIQGEHDAVANMANLAALLWMSLPRLNWAGFYRAIDSELVLGPFIGRPACIRIAIGTGVCGAAFATATTQLVPDVHAFPGHIACDALTQSELVVPILCDGQVRAVIDLDSPELSRFDEEDAAGIERFARVAAKLF
jgi:GAF domain-containing protein